MQTLREYRCPNCGSPALRTISRGYDVGNALLGRMVTRSNAGLVAGAIGSQKPMLQCVECGYSFYAWNYRKEVEKCEAKRRWRNQTMREKLAPMRVGLAVMGLIILVMWAIWGGPFLLSMLISNGIFYMALLVFHLSTAKGAKARASQQMQQKGGNKKL